MPQLTDFNRAGLQVVMLARITAGGGGVWYADGVSRTPASGSLTDGSLTIDDPTSTADGGPFTRIRYITNQLNLNDNAAWNQQTYFEGDGSDLSVYVQTDTQVMSFAIADVTKRFGGNFSLFNVPSAMQTFMAGIASGTDMLLAFARPSGSAPPAPVARSKWQRRTFQGTAGYWARVSFSATLNGNLTWRFANTATARSNTTRAYRSGVRQNFVRTLRMNKNESGSVDESQTNFASGGVGLSIENMPTAKALFLCSAAEIDRLDCYVLGTQSSVAAMQVEIWNGTAWESVESLSDGSARNGRSLNVDYNAQGGGPTTWTIPQITPPSFGGATAPNRSFRSGSLITPFTLPAATGQGTLTYSVSTLPASLQFNATTRQISGTPTTAGSVTVTYTVTDANRLTATLSFIINITQDLVPSFDTASIANQTYEQNAEITALELPEASSGDLPITYSVSTLPAGLQFTASSRRITGTPTDLGTTTVTYTATDDDGDTDTLMFTIAVVLPTAAPTVEITTPAQEVSGGQQVQAMANVMGRPTPTLQWEASAGTIDPSGLFTAPDAIPTIQLVTIRLTATNSEGSASDTVTISVRAAAPPIIPGQTGVGDYRLEIDWDGDGRFANPFSDVSDDLHHPWHTRRGINYTGQVYGRSIAGDFEFTLRNDSGRYNNLNPASPLLEKVISRRQVRVSVRPPGGSAYLRLWTGYLDDTKLREPLGGQDQARMSCLGPISLLTQQATQTPVSERITTAAAFRETLDAAGLTAAQIGDIAGARTIAFFWAPRQPALRTLRQIEETEGGLMIEGADGRLGMQSEDTRLFADDPRALITDGSLADDGALPTFRTIKALPRTPTKDIANIIRVPIQTYQVRTVATLWTLPAPVQVPAGETLVLLAAYPHPNAPNDAVGVRDWTAPTAGTDYDADADLTVTAIGSGDGLEIRLANGSASRTISVARLQARGRAIRRRDPFIIERRDAASIAKHGPLDYAVPSQHIRTASDAGQYADILLQRRADPQSKIDVRFNANDNLPLAADLELTDVVTLINRGATEDYFIDQIGHHVGAGLRHTTRLLLSPVVSYGTLITLDDPNSPDWDTGVLAR